MSKQNVAAVVAYITAIVSANLLVAKYGIGVTVINAFILIGLDLVLRDYLHDAWNDHRTRNMAILIVSAGAVSYALNPAAGQIAVASSAAFVLAALADSAVYTLAARWSWLARSNASNIAGAAVDSIAFPTIAFGGLLWPIVIGQFVAKVAGGAIWSIIVSGVRRIPTGHAAAHN